MGEETKDIDWLGYNKKGRHLSVRPNPQRGCEDYDFLAGAAAGVAVLAGATVAAVGAAAGADAAAAGATASGGV